MSFFTPRSNKIWVFIGWFKNKERQTFVDNSKYVFLNTANNHNNIRAIWIGNDSKICKILNENGYEAYSVNSLKGAYYSLRAGITVIDAIMPLRNWRYSGRSKTIQLWHADGIKKLAMKNKISIQNFFKFLYNPGLFKKFYFIITSSSYIRENFVCPSFGVTSESVKITGLPRYDSFFKDIKGQNIDLHEELNTNLKQVKSQGAEKIILYAPTFRRGKSLADQLSPLNFEKLNKHLKEKKYYLGVSLHPKFSASNWIPDKSYTNIFFSNPGYDQYPLLKEFDLIITDYSSVCIDFLLLNKPTIFYIYDIEEYRKNEGLAEEFWNHMPGPRVKTYNELISAINMPIETLMSGADEVRNEIFKYHDGNSSERVVQEILNNL